MDDIMIDMESLIKVENEVKEEPPDYLCEAEEALMSSSDPNTQRIFRSRKKSKYLQPCQILDILNEDSEDGLDWDNDNSVDDPTVNMDELSDTSDSADEHDANKTIPANGSITPSGLPSTSTSSQNVSIPIHAVWYSEKDKPLSGKLPVFQGQQKVNIDGRVPVDFFLGIVTETYLNEIVEQTQLYAVQKGKENFKFNVNDLKIFLGITLIMTFIKYPRIRHYWSSDEGIRCPVVSNNMSVNRYEEIRRFLHFHDSSKIPSNNSDKAIKIRPFLDFLHSAFHRALDPGEFHSIDEIVIPFKGRSSLKNYLPKRPKKWGFKMWVRADTSGYVHCFELYQGGTGMQASPYGVTGDVVLRLSHDICGINAKLYADNFFSNIPLVKKLKEMSIWYVGTCREMRIKEPSLNLKDIKALKKEGRGSSSVTTSSEDVTLRRWIDSSVVHTISSYVGGEPSSKARKEKKIAEITRPCSVKIDNKRMCGVDLMDSLVALFRNDVRNSRWYMRIFYHLLDVTVVNAWILWKMHNKEKTDLLEFKSKVAMGLIYSGQAQAPGRCRPSGSPSPTHLKKRATHTVAYEKRFDNFGHYPQKVEMKNANRCRDVSCKSKTRYICKKCQVPLCPECFENFHVEN